MKQTMVIPFASDFSKANKIAIDKACWPEFDFAPESYASAFATKTGVWFRLESREYPYTATRTEFGADVHNDSCIEVFLTPNTTDSDYINFEFNPNGVLHTKIGPDRHSRRSCCDSASIFSVRSGGSDSGWWVEFFVPFKFLEDLFSSVSKTEWRANFYKCGDKSPVEHYLCWNPIDTPQPDFHRSEFFGKLLLEAQ